MQKYLEKALAITVVVLVGLAPLSVYADLYPPSVNTWANFWTYDKDGNKVSAQEANPGDWDAYVYSDVPNLGHLEAGAVAHSYKEIGAWRSYPTIPDDWPQYVNQYDPSLTRSASGQSGVGTTDIIELTDGSGTGTYSWEATLTGTMSQTLATEAQAAFFIRLSDEKGWDDGYYEQRTLYVHQDDCPGGVCNETLSANFTGVPLDKPINIHFGLLVDLVLQRGQSAFAINMADTVTFQLTEILNSGGASMDLSFLQTESGTDYTKLPGEEPTQPVPEPTTMLLLGTGLLGLAGFRRKFNK